MKLLHTSDWHLGMSFRGRDIQEDQRYFIDCICTVIKEEKVDMVLLAGDVFDRSIANSDAIKLYNEAVTTVCNDIGIPMVIVAGNHDGAERLASCNVLLKKAGLYVKGVLSEDLSPIEYKDVDIYALPWFTPEKVRAVFGVDNEAVFDTDSAYKYVCDRIRERMDTNKKNILVGHAFIVNAETSTSDRAAEIGFATAVGSHIFEGFEYVALGHLHGPQNIGTNIRYSGTPMKYSFGKEELQEKSVTIIDTDTMERKIVPVDSLYGRKTIKGKYEDILQAKGMSERDRNSYVRIELEDIFASLEVVSRLQEIYPNLLEIVGKSYDGNESKITMSIEELESSSKNPLEIFKRFYTDTYGEIPSAHLEKLFEQALVEYEKEESLE